MSRTTAASEKAKEIHLIPALLTNSCRAIVEAFGENIIQLSAHGSVTTTNKSVIDDLVEYGFIREQETSHRVSIDYTQIPKTGGTEPSNVLSKPIQNSIKEHISAILDVETNTVEPDLAVTSVTIRITEERLQEVTPADTPEFDLKFVADPAEEPFRSRTRRLNADRGLYRELGFNIHNLNLREVIDTKKKYTQQSDCRYLSWQGPGNIKPQSPKKLAIRINRDVCPNKYGTLKPYYVTENQVLEIAEDEVETLNSYHQSASTGETHD